MSAASDHPQGPAAQVADAMREASALGVLYNAAVARHLGVGSADLECLDFVFANEPATAGQLARATGLTTGAITGVIDRLERAGYVIRSRCDPDRRKVLVSTTLAFRRRVEPLFEPMARAQAEVIGRYDAEALGRVGGFLRETIAAARDALAELETKAPAEPDQKEP